VETVIYLNAPLTAPDIGALLSKLGFSDAQQLMRKGEAIYKELGLKSETDQAALMAAMAKHPKLIERPIVVKGNRAILGRPPENVKEFL